MDKVSAKLAVFSLGLALSARDVGAVCLDPKDPTGNTYYYPSLEDEVKTSNAIVVATVMSVETLSEDPSDPDGWTSFIYKVRIKEVLSGNVPREIVLRAQNDSGGYRMEAGEEHLPFLTLSGDHFKANACGNSTTLPKGSQTLERLRALLVEPRHAV